LIRFFIFRFPFGFELIHGNRRDLAALARQTKASCATSFPRPLKGRTVQLAKALFANLWRFNSYAK